MQSSPREYFKAQVMSIEYYLFPRIFFSYSGQIYKYLSNMAYPPKWHGNLSRGLDITQLAATGVLPKQQHWHTGGTTKAYSKYGKPSSR